MLWSDGELDQRAFDAIDEDGSGFISEAELTEALIQASGKVDGVSRSEAAELARQMMLAADIDGDGQIEFEEFSAVLKRSRAELEAQESDAAG